MYDTMHIVFKKSRFENFRMMLVKSLGMHTSMNTTNMSRIIGGWKTGGGLVTSQNLNYLLVAECLVRVMTKVNANYVFYEKSVVLFVAILKF